LKDVGGLDLEDAIVADRGDPITARTILNRRLLHLLSAPRREDDLGIAPRDLRGIDNTIFGEPATGELRENRLATRDRNELLDPADAGDERIVPLFEKHAEPPRETRGGRPD